MDIDYVEESKEMITDFIPTIKANGENFQWSMYQDNNNNIKCIIGSKHNKIIVPFDIEFNEETKRQQKQIIDKEMQLIKDGAKIIIDKLFYIKQSDRLKYDIIINFMINFNMTVNFEFEQKDYQHLEYLEENKLVFIGLTSVYLDSITLHPYIASKIGQLMDFNTVVDNFQIHPISYLSSYIDQYISSLPEKEGFVICKVGQSGNIISLSKIKTIWYIIYRKIRGKLENYISGKISVNDLITKINEEIETIRIGENSENEISIDLKEKYKLESNQFIRYVVNFVDSLKGKTKEVIQQKFKDEFKDEFNFGKPQKEGYIEFYFRSYYPFFYKKFKELYNKDKIINKEMPCGGASNKYLNIYKKNKLNYNLLLQK